ncbi:hypothetical protein M569_10621, partial [Genlisea aurea]
WDKKTTPVRKAWIRISIRFRSHKPDHIKLGKDVRTCEYEDVHTLWNILLKNNN